MTCPKDKVMFGDALKIAPGKKLQVIDIAQLLYEAMDNPEPETEEGPLKNQENKGLN